MTIQEISTIFDGTANYDQTVTLDGEEFRMYMKWCTRDEHWYFTLRTIDEEPIMGLEGVRLVQEGKPMHCVTDPKAPKGAFFVQGPVTDEPGLFGLGNDTVLLYIPEADLDSSF